ncbi:MAG: IS4 family transposase, partial [Syntrophobacter sp.]
AVNLAYELWPRDPVYSCHGMSVIAFVGSKYDLPATEEIRNDFDSQSDLNHEGRGHYPQCLVTTAYDVFRRLPVARSIVSIHGSERDEAVALLPSIRPGSVLLFDRGYPSYELIAYLRKHHKGYFLFRCPAKSTFPAVEAFVESGMREGFIVITPSNKYLQHLTARQRRKAKGIQLRVVKLVSPEGTVSVLLTNLLNKNNFQKEEIVDLYFRRWAIEDHYRTEKVSLEIEKFHGRTSNSIRQELFAVVIMSVIARTLMVLTSRFFGERDAEYQFKNCIMTLATEAAILVPDDPQKAVVIFTEILHAIARVKYYRAKSPRPTQPRVSKRPPNKWCSGRREKLSNA